MSINNKGFTLIELMIVVAIIGVLAAIAYPRYERYIVKSKRADMINELQNVANQIQSRKLAQGQYSDALKTGLTGDYPRQGTALYAIAIDTIVVPVTPPEVQPPAGPLSDKWIITATPKAGRMANDGTLTLNYQGIKCRNITTTDNAGGTSVTNKCGSNDEWNK